MTISRDTILKMAAHACTLDPVLQEDIANMRDELALLVQANKRALQLFNEALPKFNWSASALDANAIRLLNEVPGELNEALKPFLEG